MRMAFTPGAVTLAWIVAMFGGAELLAKIAFHDPVVADRAVPLSELIVAPLLDPVARTRRPIWNALPAENSRTFMSAENPSSPVPALMINAAKPSRR